MAIGWHLYYEGRSKLASQSTEKPFSAEAYLRNATGPFAENFRNIVPDADSLDALDPEALFARWDRELKRVETHFQFDDEQRAAAAAALDETKATATLWFEDPENQKEIADYREQLVEVRKAQADPPPLAYEQERLADEAVEVEGTRRTLAGPVAGWTANLHERWFALAEGDQLETAGPYKPEETELDRVNTMTMWGLTIFGLCLIAGLLTPLMALGAAGLIFLFYISMPPWPGLPPNPMAEGTYLIVNKNVIEILALLALAATPSGLWFGVDALLFGWIDRRARARAARQQQMQMQAA